MCRGKRCLFGRTLDIECSYGEQVVLTPRNFKLNFRHAGEMAKHLAVLGMAYVADGVPLYYDAVNEAGLAMAGLNFPQSALYHAPVQGLRNVASFEFIPWVLGQCRSVREAKEMLKNTVITKDSFSQSLPAATLHWMISDRESSVVVESVAEGLRLYENRFDVMTNEPQFPYHATRVVDYMGIGTAPPRNELCPSVELSAYSRGMGAIGLPGDYSSGSRFIRAIFAKEHTASVCSDSPEAEVSRFFHVIGTVVTPLGCVRTDSGDKELTVYTSCADTDELIYYFTTYSCRRIRAVRMCDAELDSNELVCHSIAGGEDIQII